MNVLDLFSGIGMFSLGLERAGFRTVAFCESDPYCRAVLAKHWPAVPCYGDIRELNATRLAGDGIAVDAICGGFPCQDISCAGKGAGLAGARSGLWSEYSRLIGELRPAYVIVENVSALLGRGLDTVLGDLASIGYDAEWHCIPAAYVGAPHRRDRIWIVAYPEFAERWPNAASRRSVEGDHGISQGQESPGRFESDGEAVADSARLQSRRSQQWAIRERTGASSESADDTDAEAPLRRRSDAAHDTGRRDTQAGGLGLRGSGAEHWLVEPDVGRVAHGVPSRVDRLRALGNSLVPQIAEIIGKAIMNQCSAAQREVVK